jgi:hypothetical protein
MTVDEWVAWRDERGLFCIRRRRPEDWILCVRNAVNYGGRVHVFNNLDVRLPRCFAARACLFCGLLSPLVPYGTESLHVMPHKWDSEHTFFGCTEHRHLHYQPRHGYCLAPLCGRAVRPMRAVLCDDCGQRWTFDRTRSKDKLL